MKDTINEYSEGLKTRTFGHFCFVMGGVFSAMLSYKANASIAWAILHWFLGWWYVAYYFIIKFPVF